MNASFLMGYFFGEFYKVLSLSAGKKRFRENKYNRYRVIVVRRNKVGYVSEIRTIVLLLGIQSGLGMIGYCWLNGRKISLLYRFIVYQILLTLWLCGQTLPIFAGWPALVGWLSQVEYFAVCFMGWGWFSFCLQYGDHTFLSGKWNRIVLGLIPAVAYIFGLINRQAWMGWSGTAWAGPWGENSVNLSMLQSYVFCGAGTVLLLRYFFRQCGKGITQITLLVLALILPYGVNGVLMLGWIQTDFGSFPVSFMISVGVCFSLSFKDKLLDLTPFAWRQVCAELPERILVVDNYNRITCANGSLGEVFPHWDGENPMDLTALINALDQVGESTPKRQKLLQILGEGNEETFRTEIKLLGPEDRWLRVKIRPFWSGPAKLGRIISLSDISERQRILSDFRRRNHQLEAMNRRLREHAAAVEESAIVQERNRFARDLHDTVGQTMNLLMTLLQVGMIYCRKDPAVTERKLGQAIRLVEEGLSEVRRSLLGLSIIQSNSDNLMIAIKNLLASYESTGLQRDLKVDGCSGGLNIKVADVIYRLIQEALTNAVRHGKAKNIAIKLTFTPEKTRIFIQDDGGGSREVTKGMGLTGMETRVRALNGWIRIHSEAGRGFRIEAELPKGSPKLPAEDQEAP